MPTPADAMSYMETHPHRATIERANADRRLLSDAEVAQVVEETIALLDQGKLRVATPPASDEGEWPVHAWVKDAILLYFALRKMEVHEVGPFEFYDKIPLKKGLAEAGVRVVPPGT